VTGAASAAGVSIATAPNSTLECAIIGTILYPAVIGSGHVTLELSVIQLVYAAAINTSDSLTQEIVRNLVEYGFNQSHGGSAKFRMLLSEKNAVFESLQDIGVQLGLIPISDQPSSSLVPSSSPVSALDFSVSEIPTSTSTFEPSITPSSDPVSINPTPPPTGSPTLLPTIIPSYAPSAALPTRPPTSIPTILLTKIPTPAPTLLPTTLVPTDTPSQAPTARPSITMTFSPLLLTLAPTTSPTVGISTNQPTALAEQEKPVATGPSTAPVPTILSNNSPASSTKMEPSIVAAIACGALVAIVAFCSFLFFCLKRRNTKEDDQDSNGFGTLRPTHFDTRAPRSDGSKSHHFGSRASSSKSNRTETKVLPFIPTEVNLDDDGQSLADTTLGDQTAGRRPLKKKKRLISAKVAYASFDEESLYTSTEKNSERKMYGIQHSSEIEDDDSVGNSRNNTNDNIDYNNFFMSNDALTGHSDSVKNFKLASEVSPRSPIAGKIAALLDAELNGSDSDSFHSGLYMNNTDSPISVALSNCEQNKKMNVFDRVNFDKASFADIANPLEGNTVTVPMERESVADLQSNGHDHKLLSGRISRESDDQSSDSDSSKSIPFSRSDSRSSTTKKVDNLAGSMAIDSSSSLKQIESMSQEVENNLDPFSLGLAMDSNSSPLRSRKDSRPLKRPTVRPWAPTTLQYRTRPLEGGAHSKLRRFTPVASSKNGIHRVKQPRLDSETLGVKLPHDSKDSDWFCSDDEKDKDDLSEPFGGTFGHQSGSNDFESLGSTILNKSIPSIRPRASASVGSHGLRRNSSEEKNTNYMVPRSLDQQLSSLDKANSKSDRSTSSSTISGGRVAKSVISQSSSTERPSTNHRVIVVIVPTGKLGITLANCRDGKGTVISEVRQSSVLSGSLVAGDKLVAIDGLDVRGMAVSQISSILASRSQHERQLTVMTTTELRSLVQEP